MQEQRPVSPNTPDLQIFVRRDDPRHLAFEVHSARLGLNNQKFGFLTLEGDAKAQAQDEPAKRVDRLSILAEKGVESRVDADRQLADLGVTLFARLPAELRRLLLLAVGDIRTLQILSDEPYVPWELMKLQGDGGEEGPFLCEAFRVTRWLRDFPQVVFEFPLRSIAFVLGANELLPSAAAEMQDLIALAGAKRVSEIPATFQKVSDALRTGDYDGWHFCGHATSKAADPDFAAFYLTGDDQLVPTNLGAAKAGLIRAKPLVFLNACSTGQGGYSLTGLGGWAKQSLDAGAGAFLGTLWKVGDQKARSFAQSFYRAFLGGETIGEAVHLARIAVREEFPGDPAWLAYILYASPAATCSLATGRQAPRGLSTSRLRLPELGWRPGISPPGALLRAEYGVVPFHGREKERAELFAWCMEGFPVRVRLYTGPGGMGKTRLALEIGKLLRKEGWRAGFLEPEDVRTPEEAWRAISRHGGRVLAIVDYAETRRELLIPLLRRLHATEEGPIRLILLARAALDWWEQLKVEGHGVGELLSGPATSRHSLQPLTLDEDLRRESYDRAGASFAERLNLRAPSERPEDLGAELFERVLLLHMAALAAVEGIQVQGEDGVLDYVLQRETRYWTQRANSLGFGGGLVLGIGRAMAAITLSGGVASEPEAIEILRLLQAFEGHTGDVLLRVAHLLHECYPGNRWIEPILPDLLGEHLVQREMERGADELLDLVLGPAEKVETP